MSYIKHTQNVEIHNKNSKVNDLMMITCVDITDRCLLVQAIQLQQVIIVWLFLQILHIFGGFVEQLIRYEHTTNSE